MEIVSLEHFCLVSWKMLLLIYLLNHFGVFWNRVRQFLNHLVIHHSHKRTSVTNFVETILNVENKKIDAQQLRLFSVLFGNHSLWWLFTETCRFNLVDEDHMVTDFSNTEVHTCTFMYVSLLISYKVSIRHCTCYWSI